MDSSKDEIGKVLETIKNLSNLSEWDMSEMIRCSEDVAKQLKNKNINMTQIRKFHGHICRIWSKYSMNRSDYLKDTVKFKREIRDEIVFVKAYLAYQAGREPKLEDLKEVLETAINKIQNQKDFEYFKKFYDSILAYFKFYDSILAYFKYYGSQKGGQEK